MNGREMETIGNSNIKPRSEAVKQKQRKRADRLRKVWEQKKSELGLLQKDVARMLGWKTQGAVGHVFSGSTPLTIDLLLEFCEILQVSPRLIVPELQELFKYDELFEGSSSSGQLRDVDLNRLGICIKTIEEAGQEIGISLPVSTKSRLVEFLYAELSKSNINQDNARELADRLIAIANSPT